MDKDDSATSPHPHDSASSDLGLQSVPNQDVVVRVPSVRSIPGDGGEHRLSTHFSQRAVSSRTSSVVVDIPMVPDKPHRRSSYGVTLQSDSEVDSSVGSETALDVGGHGTGGESSTFCDAIDRRVPFTAQVVFLMLIPIAFLVGIVISRFVEGMDQLLYVQRNEDFMLSLGECQLKTMLERGYSSQYIVTNGSGYDIVATAKTATDLACLAALDGGVSSSDGLIKDVWAPQMRQYLFDLNVARHRVQKLDMTPLDERNFYTSVVDHLQKGRTLFMRNKAIANARVVTELIKAYGALNTLGQARTIGAHILTVINHTTSNELTKLVAELTDTQRATKESQAFLAWLSQSSVVAVELNALTANAMRLMAAMIADPHSVHLTADQWFSEFSTAVTIPDALKELTSNAVQVIVIDTLLLVFGGFAASLCAALIILAQLRVMRRIRAAMEANRKIQKAVLTFVPKAFLRLSGCTSILQIQAGEHNEVAASMLFSDIRAFTSISEHMTNPELFDWLQRYFAEMTVIVEKHKGFIDKFIGDAVFAIFTSPSNAVKCGVGMQTSVGHLNLDIVSSGGTYLVKIGVGVHHAVVCVGFLGDSQRITCTMISSEVNIASRLEGLTKRYDAGILVSSEAMDQIPDAVLGALEHRNIGRCEVKGATKQLTITEVFQADPLPLKQHKAETKALFEDGVERRQAGDLDGGNAKFQEVVRRAEAEELIDGAAAFKLSHNDTHDIFHEK